MNAYNSNTRLMRPISYNRNTKILIAVLVIVIVIVLGILLKRKLERFDGDGQNTVTVKYYFSPTCGWCNKFKDEWTKFQATADPSLITCNPIDATDPSNSKLVSADNVSGYPTIIIVKNGNQVQYKGDRTAIAINDFIANM